MKRFLTILMLIFCLQNCSMAKANVQWDFERALNKGDIEQATECLKNGADINKECYLCYAVLKKQQNVFDFLIENGANPDGTTKMQTPLFFALDKRNNDMVDKLISHNANPNKETTPPLLYLAVVKNYPYGVEKLLYAGADINKTFMKVTPVQLAFSNNNEEILNTIIKFQEKDFKTPATDIDASIELLNTIENGKPFYKAIKGENRLNKPVIVRYTNLSNFGDYDTDIYYSVAVLKDKQLYIYIDNKYRNEPPEAIALLVAGGSIHIDNRHSKTEYLYRFGAQALMYEEFLIKNPDLRLNKNSVIIQKTFNPLLTLVQKADYNMNVLWSLANTGAFEKGLRETSPGYRNTDLNSYFETVLKSE